MVKAFKKRGVPRFNARGFLLTEIGLESASNKKKEVDESFKLGHASSYGVGILKYFLPIVTQLPLAVFRSDDIEDMRYVKARFALQDPSLNYFCGVFMSSLTDIMSYIEDNHEMLIKDIEEGIIDPSIKIGEKTRKRLERKLKPDLKRAAELREIFNTKSDTPLINRLWKNMSYIFAIGKGDFEPFTRKMRSYCEEDVVFGFVMYASTEATMGCAIYAEDPSYLLVNDDCYFEFLPVDEKVKRPLLMHELEVDHLYEIILTNKVGFYRYQLGDIVRVMKMEGESPYVQFAYRDEFLTNIAAIHLTGEALKESIQDIERKFKMNIIDYSIHPNSNLKKPRIDLYIETEKPAKKRVIDQISSALHEALLRYSYSYEVVTKAKDIDKVKVYILKQGTYTSYREKRVEEGAALNQLKTIRVIRTKEQYAFFQDAVEVECSYNKKQ